VPIEFIDKGEEAISGDPPPQRPLSQKQMTGAMNRTVNRTALGPHAVKSAGAESDGQAEGKAKQGSQAEQGQANGKAEAEISPDTPILGGLQKMGGQIATEAKSALGGFDPAQFNPAHPLDYAKLAAEGPVDTYYLGRHIWQGLNAMFDPEAAVRANHDLYGQDNAINQLFAGKGWAGEGGPSADVVNWLNSLGPKDASDKTEAQKYATQGKPEGQPSGASDLAVSTLAMEADPRYLPMMISGQRGPALVAAMLGPSVGNAIFADRNSPAELAWGFIPAILLGGKVPPAVEKELAAQAPGLAKLVNKLSATKRVQDQLKTSVQDREKFIRELQQTAQPEDRRVVARAWQAGMKPLTSEAAERVEKQITAALQKKGGSAEFGKQFGSMKPEEVVAQMVKAGTSEKLIAKAWTYLAKMPYDLLHISPAEPSLHWWTDYAHELPSAVREKVEKNWQWTFHAVNQAELGIAGNHAAPEASRWRSLIGMTRTNDLVMREWENHLRDVGAEELANPQELDRLYRAIEGDEGAYRSLSAPMRYVRDSMRMVAAGLRRAAHDSGYSEDFVHNFWARVPLLIKEGKNFRPMGRGGDLLARQVQKHRALGTRMVDNLLEDRLQIEQRYGTVQEANQAQARLRSVIADDILKGTPVHQIEGVPETDHQAIERIRAVSQIAPEVARMDAEHYAEQIAPDFSTDPFDSMRRVSGYLRSISSHRAISDLMQSVGKDGKAMAVFRPSNDDRAMRMLLDQGYRAVGARGFQDVLVSSKYAELLEKATKVVGSRGNLLEDIKNRDWRALADLEGQAVSMIMYSPRIHGMNMAARLGMLGAMHPLEVVKWLKGGLLQKTGVTQVGHEDYRMEAWRAGVIPPHPQSSGWADRFAGTMAEQTGDHDLTRTPLIQDMVNSELVAKSSSGAKMVLGKMKDIAWGRQSDLWSWVSDFGVMAYQIEKQSAIKSGRFANEEEASLYAARRANSWMGHVAPEDTNPTIHAMAKTLAFAPNWWRTWAELLTGVYKNSGVGWTQDTVRYVVQNEIRTAMAGVALQQMTANALNLMLGGHTIYQNDPGNWGKVEITQPWAVDILNNIPGLNLGIDPKTGRNAKGQKLTMENPVARQMVSTQEALGLLTSAPMWSPSTLEHGSLAFAAGRESPVVQAFGALANIDTYASIASGGLRYIDPNHDNIFGNPGVDALAALASLTPFSYVAQQAEQAMVAGKNPDQEVSGAFGLPIPKWASDTFGAQQLGGDALKSLLIGMSGVNPPYMRSSKSFGVQPTDDQYKTVHEIQDTYTQNMNALSTATLSGQMTPDQWVASYRQLSTKRADQLQAIFKHAPEYNDGPLGLTNSWENLYDQAAVNGITDPDKLRSLQEHWRATHSSADFAAVQSTLRQSDQKYPMLALYHKTLDAYANWQSDYAKENGIDLETLRHDLSGYAQVYNNRLESQQYLAEHPDILPFENAKKSEFESGDSRYTEAGLMYALFFNPTLAERYMAGGDLSAAQVEQEVQQQQVPAAP